MKKIILHGLGQSPEDWNFASRYDESFVCIDCFGQISPFSYQACKKSLLKRIERGEFGNEFTLIGHSFGAMLAIEAAASSSKIKSIILIAPQARSPKNLLKLQNMLFKILPASTFQSSGLTKNQMIEMCSSMMDLDLRKALQSLQIPGTVIIGEKDKANKKAFAEIQKMKPDWNYYQIRGGSHEINKDCPEELLKVLGLES